MPLALRHSPPAVLAAFLSAAGVVLAGIVALTPVEVGPISLQMVHHIGLMNVAAPLLAVALTPALASLAFPPLSLWLFGGAQMALLWTNHAPPVARAISQQPGLQLGATLALAAVAFLFWSAVLSASRERRWGAIAGLLVTGKLACLLGGLLIFATRDLYGLPGFAFAFCTAGPSTLEDQQLAGLLMITACPLSYVTAAVVLAAAALEDAAAPRAAAPVRHG
ncbi:cytochrome c oxidase assembly protein [Xanthobacter sp. VTT E-85241]|uniref:cytochrome c oxidase assembly protein n=1 Tax=Roseixanthobacter finlandensis TaxID=3119922 RepID=UPI00372BAE58